MDLNILPKIDIIVTDVSFIKVETILERVIDSFTYKLKEDDRIGIVGSNGSGKSTLLNILSGKILADSGDLKIGQTVKIGYFTQENEDFNQKLTCKIFEDNEGINYMKQLKSGDLACCGYQKLKFVNLCLNECKSNSLLRKD